MTETATQPEADMTPADGPTAADFDQQALVDETRCEAEAMEIGELVTDERLKTLYRYLRRRGQLAAEAERLRENLHAMLKEITRKVETLDYLYQEEAKATVRDMLAGKKAKSLKTPFGVAGFRTIAAKVEVVDEATLIKAAESDVDLMALVRTETRVSRSDVADHFKRTGELPPGCELSAAYEKFHISEGGSK